jgi:hypothetical protein
VVHASSGSKCPWLLRVWSQPAPSVVHSCRTPMAPWIFWKATLALSQCILPWSYYDIYLSIDRSIHTSIYLSIYLSKINTEMNK